MAATEKVTWANVCQKVRIGDTLHSTCREKVSDYKGYPDLTLPPPDEPDGLDFSSRIRKTAQPIPPPPPADWQADPSPLGFEGFEGGRLSDVMQTELPTKLLWGAVGALVLLLLLSSKRGETSPKTA